MMGYALSRGTFRGSSRGGGFSLIELMIVISIIGIISMIAYPMYTDNVRQSRRAEARAILQDYAARQERFFSRNNTYANTFGATGLNVPATSENGHYTLALGTLPAPLNSYASSFVITATATGAQAEDAGCLTFTIDSQGTRTGCW
ncbi:MAG TPA: type IV pilin protein [Gammaproteobacteria bacterium]